MSEKSSIDRTYESFIHQIREERRKSNITQKEVAEALNITKGAYSNIERGISKLSLHNFIFLVNYLGIDFSSLINDKTKLVIEKNETHKIHDFEMELGTNKKHKIISNNMKLSSIQLKNIRYNTSTIKEFTQNIMELVNRRLKHSTSEEFNALLKEIESLENSNAILSYQIRDAIVRLEK